MPTEVFELSPQQLDWLYEHQTLKNVDGFHHLDVISPAPMLTPATPHLTPTKGVTLSPQSLRNHHFVDLRRDSMTHDTASSTSHNSLGTQSPELVHEGIIFPFQDERPSWEQSLANLLSYKERHGVRVVLHKIEEENDLFSMLHHKILTFSPSLICLFSLF